MVFVQGLAPWRLTFCYLASNVKPPRPEAVASSFGLKIGVATIVKFHGGQARGIFFRIFVRLILSIPTTPSARPPKLHSTVNLLTNESMLPQLRSETETG